MLQSTFRNNRMLKCMLNNLFFFFEVPSLNPTSHPILIYLYPLPQKIYLFFHIFVHQQNTTYLLFLTLTICFLKTKALSRCRCNLHISHFQKPFTELSFPSLATSLCYKSVTLRSCNLTDKQMQIDNSVSSILLQSSDQERVKILCNSRTTYVL